MSERSTKRLVLRHTPKNSAGNTSCPWSVPVKSEQYKKGRNPIKWTHPRHVTGGTRYEATTDTSAVIFLRLISTQTATRLNTKCHCNNKQNEGRKKPVPATSTPTMGLQPLYWQHKQPERRKHPMRPDVSTNDEVYTNSDAYEVVFTRAHDTASEAA